MAEIRIDRLHKRFGDFVAVQRIELTVADGEFFVLLGPSGCGKTTTLRMIAGLEIPTSGEIRLGGEDVTFRRARERDIAFVFQLFALYPHMNVRKNIGFPLLAQGTPRAEIRTPVEETARLLRIEHLLDRPVGGLVRRRPPARGARPRHRPPPQGVPDGRAARRARRRVPRADVRGAAPAAQPHRRHHRLRHPRPDRGHGDGRPDRGDGQGRGPAVRHAGRHLSPAALDVRRRLHRQPGHDLPRRPRPPARGPRRGRRKASVAVPQLHEPATRRRRCSASGRSTSRFADASRAARPGVRRRIYGRAAGDHRRYAGRPGSGALRQRGGRARFGEIVGLEPDPARVVLFDKASGRAARLRPATLFAGGGHG